ncbi:MAG: acyl-CoA thioesterase [Prevotellaceae bacterium]|jgi:acyl-CoA thioester hydrolase|nr:acyl-CoA thioesterase [Prevotellaceae bacterium]
MLSTPIQIRFSDIDGLGHVNNSVYTSYFDVGRLDYLRRVLGSDFELADELLIMVHIEQDYKIQTRLNDQIAVRTRVVSIGCRSLRMEQELVNLATGQVHATCRSVMSGFSKITQQSVELKEEWRFKFENLKI